MSTNSVIHIVTAWGSQMNYTDYDRIVWFCEKSINVVLKCHLIEKQVIKLSKNRKRLEHVKLKNLIVYQNRHVFAQRDSMWTSVV